MNNLKVWPHLTIVAIVVAVAAGVGVALWMRNEPSAAAEAIPNAARIQRVEGDVALNNGLVAGDNSQADQWYTASANQPFSVGDRIYTRDNSRASLAFTGRNFARLNQNTSLDVLALSDERTQLALRDGSAVFDVGYLDDGDLFEVATPYGAVDFREPGLYNVGIDNGQVLISVLSGLAQVVGMGGSGEIGKGEILTLLGSTAADVVLSQINGDDAGYLVDDYYGYQYPNYYDGRYRDYNSYLSDPYYFDPYRRSVSYQYVNSYIPGLHDLDYYGDWQNIDGYGYSWAPRVDAGWMPYQSGYWQTDYPYGPTWISAEPWGYAPYHYGRWAFVGDRWYWVPDNVSTTPVYSPALVSFIPFGSNDIGWVALGPGDVYVPRYYDTSWQPHYFTRDNLYQRVVNLNVPGAVTVVSVDEFSRGFDWRRARRADRNALASVNPVLDPLLVTPLRNAVVNSAWGRGKKDIPPGIARKLQDTTVITSTDVVAPAFKRDLAKSMRVERVSDRAKGQQFKVRDERPGRGTPQAANQPVPAERGGRPDDRGGPPAERGGNAAERGDRGGPPADRGNAVAPAERRTGPPADRGRSAREIPRAAPREQPRNDRASTPQAERPVRPAQQRPQADRVSRPVPRAERPAARTERPAPRPAQRTERPAPAPRVEQPRPQPNRQAQPNKPQAQPRVMRTEAKPVRSQPTAPTRSAQPAPARQQQQKAAKPEPAKGGGKPKKP